MLLVLVKAVGPAPGLAALSYASLAVTALWIFMALRARREYLHGVPAEHRARGT